MAFGETSPAPTLVAPPSSVMPGADTVTVWGVAARKLSAVADTVVEPPPYGSNTTPPAARVVGELYCPDAIVTSRLCPTPALVTSCATLAAEFVTVTLMDCPGRTGWLVDSAPPPAGTGPA